MLADDIQHMIATVPLDLRGLASTIGSPAAQGKISRSELAPDVTDGLRQGISDLADMVRYNHSAKEALETLEHLCALWTASAPSESQQQQAHNHFPFSFHVQNENIV